MACLPDGRSRRKGFSPLGQHKQAGFYAEFENNLLVEPGPDLAVTLGQYLSPSRAHPLVDRYVTPATFDELGEYARSLGFRNVTSGPLVRSSYHAKEQGACTAT